MSADTNGLPKIGVYVCHCGTNIAGDGRRRARWPEYAAGLPGVTVARDYKYMCSDPGQELIKEDIRANGLDRMVVASCSPSLHEAHLPAGHRRRAGSTRTSSRW